MKSILLLTTIYPLPTKDNKGTPVCHYFAREWVKMGYGVRVVHFQAVFPQPLYWIARLNRKKIAAKTGAVVYTERDKGAVYEQEGVKVNRIPLFKPIPHGGYSKRAIRKAVEKIVAWNGEAGFVPDIIVGHFPNPQIEVVGLLKETYTEAATAIVMHGDVELAKKVYGTRLLPLAQKIDIWGFRNKAVERQFELGVMKAERSFICYSGIPEDYITTENTHRFDGKPTRYVYVGEMIERKYPVAVMDALKEAYPEGDYAMTYVGGGQLLNDIRSRVEAEGLQQKVQALGKIPRDDIKGQYDKADVMVMISRGEAYGLVYLEAMARGCITIASRNEGFDGIIVDGENGFLCKAGDAHELAQTMRRIEAMSREEKAAISERAIQTAKGLTDFKAAKLYIDDVNKLIENTKVIMNQRITPPQTGIVELWGFNAFRAGGECLTGSRMAA